MKVLFTCNLHSHPNWPKMLYPWQFAEWGKNRTGTVGRLGTLSPGTEGRTGTQEAVSRSELSAPKIAVANRQRFGIARAKSQSIFRKNGFSQFKIAIASGFRYGLKWQCGVAKPCLRNRFLGSAIAIANRRNRAQKKRNWKQNCPNCTNLQKPLSLSSEQPSGPEIRTARIVPLHTTTEQNRTMATLKMPEQPVVLTGHWRW